MSSTYSVEKKDDGHDLNTVESILVPVVPRAPGDAIEPTSDQTVTSGNSSEPDLGLPQPVVATSHVTVPTPQALAVPASDRDSVSSSSSATAVRVPSPSPSPSPSNAPARKEVISTSPAAIVDSLTPPFVDDVAMEVDDNDGLAMAMEVDNHASLDGTPSVQSVDLDSLDLSKAPAWLQTPLKHLRKKFRGELEDKVLSAFVALEMGWQPVSAQWFLI